MKSETKKDSVMKGFENIDNGLDKAQFIKNISTQIGFDTNNSIGKAFNKIKEEFGELQEEISAHSSKHKSSTDDIQKEMGDLLFAICGLANKLDVKAKDCLDMTIEKFIFRTCHVEKKLKENGQDFKNGNIEDMCNWWQDAKKIK